MRISEEIPHKETNLSVKDGKESSRNFSSLFHSQISTLGLVLSQHTDIFVGFFLYLEN